MEKYFESKVRFVERTESGKERKITITFLVLAEGIAEAQMGTEIEAIKCQFDVFEILSVKQSNITYVIPSSDDNVRYVVVKMQGVIVDEESGKEKKVTDYWLVISDDIVRAVNEAKAQITGGIMEVTGAGFRDFYDLLVYLPELT